MIVSLEVLFLLIMPAASSFRAPENPPRNLELPGIQSNSNFPIVPDSRAINEPHRHAMGPYQANLPRKRGVDKSFEKEYWYK